MIYEYYAEAIKDIAKNKAKTIKDDHIHCAIPLDPIPLKECIIL